MTWILQGILLGLVLTLSTGPSFFYLIKVGIEKGFKKALAFAFGIFLSDILLLALIFIGLQPLFKNEVFNQAFSLCSGIIILVFGITMLLNKSVNQSTSKEVLELNQNTELPYYAYILKGSGINLFNPFTIIMWVGVLGTVSPSNTTEFTQFVGGILGVIFLADASKAYMAKLIGKLLTNRAIVIMNRILALAFMIIGFYFIYLSYNSFTTGETIHISLPEW